MSLPEDIAPYIPSVADSWLKQYELTQTELIVNRVVWSEAKQYLIFPYFDDKNFLYGWQGRYFGNNSKHPKWIGHGNFKQVDPIYGNNTKTIVLVEDIISCIKVARVSCCCPLFGSFINPSRICTLNNKLNPEQFFIWLDKDKMKESYIYNNTLNKLGISSSIISTQEDPKKYSTEQIKELLNIP